MVDVLIADDDIDDREMFEEILSDKRRFSFNFFIAFIARINANAHSATPTEPTSKPVSSCPKLAHTPINNNKEIKVIITVEMTAK